jgi:hypothetical protein
LLKKYATTRIFKIHQSSLVIKALWASHIIAFTSVFLTALMLIYKAIIIALIFISLFYYLKRETKFPVFFIRHSLAFGWEIAILENHFHSFDVLSSTVLTHFLIVLHIKQQNRKKQTILICKDALKNDEFRKLMVELKISGLRKDIA